MLALIGTSWGRLSAAVRRDDAASLLEMFFDLVFVFALIRVTASMAADLSAVGVLRGLLVVALLSWSWVVYAWWQLPARR